MQQTWTEWSKLSSRRRTPTQNLWSLENASLWCWPERRSGAGVEATFLREGSRSSVVHACPSGLDVETKVDAIARSACATSFAASLVSSQVGSQFACLFGCVIFIFYLPPSSQKKQHTTPCGPSFPVFSCPRKSIFFTVFPFLHQAMQAGCILPSCVHFFSLLLNRACSGLCHKSFIPHRAIFG